MRIAWRICRTLLALACLLGLAAAGFAQTLPQFDFSQSAGAAGWMPAHDIARLQRAPEGLAVFISGSDPYLMGPPRNYPPGQPLWLTLRLKSDQGGVGQVFYYRTGPTEADSVRFAVPTGQWFEARVPLPALGAKYRIRIDPPGDGGVCVLGKLSFELRPQLAAPVWPKPLPPVIAQDSPVISSGELSLRHGSEALDDFEAQANGKTMAAGARPSLIGYLSGGVERWFTLTNPIDMTRAGSQLRVRLEALDPDGGHWQIERIFAADFTPGIIDVTSRVTVDRDRSIIYLPMIAILPGVEAFGANKTQAVFPGLEYLENEPSSSQADVTGPASNRRVPSVMKVTFPLMALAADGNYVGLMWTHDPKFAALFDSPDRLFNSGGHLMGLIFPGANPDIRDDGSVLPYGGQTLSAGTTLELRAAILGGAGRTVVPALQKYIARWGWPVLPRTGVAPSDYYALAAHGWLDSAIRRGTLFRHAVAPNFNFGPAADAALDMDWLAARVEDADLSSRLANLAYYARAAVLPANYNSAGVGHIRFPAEALVYGSVAENAAQAAAEGWAQVRLFRPDGSIWYEPPPGETDLGKTHWARDANGLTASHVVAVLRDAIFSGDPALTKEGLRLLRALDKFSGTVPRGAQTWEVPLHTPDILASAWLADAYLLGYELTQEPSFLDQARYWAWTGVPFVYLTRPTNQPVGLYSTIPVFGATEFVYPWFGLPVQWCGLVYAEAIRELAPYDPGVPWAHLANGIAASGIQQTHPLNDGPLVGLLPDSFNLRAQFRNAPGINPATLFPEAIQLYGAPPIYSFHCFIQHRLMAHAPGSLSEFSETERGVRFRAESWSKRPWRVLLNGFTATPIVKINGRDTPLQPPHQFQSTEGRLILELTQPSRVEIILPP